MFNMVSYIITITIIILLLLLFKMKDKKSKSKRYILLGFICLLLLFLDNIWIRVLLYILSFIILIIELFIK